MATRKTGTRKPAVRKAVAKPRKGARAAAKRRSAKPMKLGGVSSDAVRRATGRAWDEWLKLLDRAGAKKMPHKEIALLLSRKFGVPNWWSQMVTVGYEQARGIRAVYQKAGGYSANVSRTLGTGLGRVYDAWNDPKQRERWLPGAPIEVRRSTDGKSMRITWTADGTHVDVGFFRKGDDKSQVALEHSKLKSAAAVAKSKAFWSDALGRLKALLEPVT